MLSRNGGPAEPVPESLPIGETVAFQVVRQGIWPGTVQVEWLVNGQRYKYAKADDPKASVLNLDSGDLQGGPCAVAVRLFDAAGKTPGKILAHRAASFTLKQQSVELSPFTVQGFRERDNTLTPLKGLAVQNGDTLRFTADVPLPQGKPSTLTRLVWQVYDDQGRPLPGMTKESSQTADKKQIKSIFRFRPDQFAGGTYIVALTHHRVSDPKISVQAKSGFDLKDRMTIIKSLITADREKMAPQKIFHPGEAPLFYVYYDLADPSQKVTVTLTAETAGGRIIDSATVDRPRTGESRPYRVGFTIPGNALKAGQAAQFTAKISDGTGARRTVSESFRVEDYAATILMPATLSSGKSATFSVTVPPHFTSPFTLSLNTGPGLNAGRTPGSLKGTLTGIAENAPVSTRLDVRVTDAAGRLALGSATLNILPKKKIIAAKPKKPILLLPAQEVPVTASPPATTSGAGPVQHAGPPPPSGPSRQALILRGKKKMRSSIEWVIQNMEKQMNKMGSGATGYFSGIPGSGLPNFFNGIPNWYLSQSSQDDFYRFGLYDLNNNYSELSDFQGKLHEEIKRVFWKFAYNSPYSRKNHYLINFVFGSYEQVQLYEKKFKAQITAEKK